MSDPMWENPTEPRTEAGRRLIAAFPSNAADASSPAFIRHVAQSILAIEAEAAAPRAATEPPLDPGMSNDIKLVANAILGSTNHLPHREAAERLLAAPRAATGPKPDGWHMYHICGGKLRELTWQPRPDLIRQALCIVCGEWFTATVEVRGEAGDKAEAPRTA